MSGTFEFPRALSWDTNYWLCRCEGFHVDAPTGRVGVVEEVRFETRLDRPDTLVVRGGLVGSRVLLVPVSDVKDVAPRQQRLVLARAPDDTGNEPIRRLRAFLGKTFGTAETS
jgi:hypothetical protein